MKRTCLPDVNFWLAFAFQRHEHHVPAATWMTEVPGQACAFCRMTQQGFLRLATNPRVLAEDTLTMAQAWRAYDDLFDDPRVLYCEEPDGLEPHWRQYTERSSFSPKVWNDAYLAAFAMAAGFEVVTFDQGFVQFKGLSSTILS